jgi:hypothetical protein
MESKINIQLNVIEKAVKVVKETESMRGAKGETAHKELVKFRRKLNKKKFALEGNPAAAMYGESQMGKSYLVGSLLSESGKPFTVIDGTGNSYDFINEINPIGKGAESTSLVTRFSTDYEWKHSGFPVKAKLLSPADLVIVLCDSYYNDVKAKIDIALKSDAISEKVAELYNNCESKFAQQTLLGEDDILDIREYFLSNFSTKASNVIHSEFFNKISALIAKTQPNEWSEIFALLWNKNEKITKLFSELLKQYAKLDFSNEIYLPVETVLRNNGTVLDVARLHEIYGRHEGSEQNYKPETTIMIFKNGQEKSVNNFSKSYLCALTAELIFKLPSELENSKEFLKNTDLLDFPGARHRLGIHEEDIEDKVIPQMLLRGKVAYLFNKYSYSEKINILLFCHGDRQSAQSVMPEMLNNWIGDMIGKTIEERDAFISNSKVPPLFVISTMFNLDLQFDFNNDREGNRSFLESRWEKRFLRVLKREIFGSETYTWLNKWTTSNQDFQNIYLLRDFYYSSETNSKIFEGYNKNKIENKEIIPETYPDFRKDLRQSFIEYDFVKQHFEDPVESWDRAASINEDGTQLIIDKLTVASNNISIARCKKTVRELNAITQDIIDLLDEYYDSSDKAKNLMRAIDTAGKIRVRLAAVVDKNRYFFGPMMKELMLNKSDVYSLYMEKIHDIERSSADNIGKHQTLRLQVPELNPNKSFDENLKHLQTFCRARTLKDCRDRYEAEGYDLNELFYGDQQRVKNSSQVLAEALETYWFDTCPLEKRQNLVEVFSDAYLPNIRDMLRSLFKKLQIAEIIAGRIRRYVDGYRYVENMYEMIADISAEMFNKFINSVGLEYYSESNFAELKKASENIEDLSRNHDELQFEQISREEVAELIAKMEDELLNTMEDAMRLPYYRSYIAWYYLLEKGFVTASGVPKYDPIANEKLAAIINECKTVKY